MLGLRGFASRALWRSGIMVLGSALLLTSSAEARAASGSPRALLQDLLAQYESLASVHLRAEAVITRDGGSKGSASGHGTIEYWEDADGSYRVRCATEGIPELFDDVDLAFDGETFRAYYPGMNAQFELVGDSVQSPAALPNPFYVPLTFGRPMSEECGICRLRFSMLRSIDLHLRSADSDSLRELETGRGESAGLWLGPLAGRDDGSSHEVRFRTDGQDGELTSMERRTAEGRLATRYEFSEWEKVSGSRFAFPRKLSIRDFDPAGEVVLRVDYRVSEISVAEDFAPSLFRPSILPDTVTRDATIPEHPEIPSIDP